MLRSALATGQHLKSILKYQYNTEIDIAAKPAKIAGCLHRGTKIWNPKKLRAAKQRKKEFYQKRGLDKKLPQHHMHG